MLKIKYQVCARFRACLIAKRCVADQTNTWDAKYKRSNRVDLENYWKTKLKERWDKREISAVDDSQMGEFYCLSMFPYPSGKLHMGHMRVYTISDTFAHFYRMRGYKVLHPMGWDAFGLPAENAARDRGLDPKKWTESNIAYMKQQLEELNFMFDWDREISTCDPDYYKWTQHIFTKLFERGLAYRKSEFVNWDPVDNTVLADEQVDENGCSWRSGAKVEKKFLKQWFLRTSEYAESLLNTLEEINEDVGIKAMQKHWIGEADGCYIRSRLNIKISKNGPLKQKNITIFCPTPEAIYGATHVTLNSAKGRVLVEDLTKNEFNILQRTRDECTSQVTVPHPLTGEHLPVIISTIDEKYGNVSAVLSIPTDNERDRENAEKYRIPCKNMEESIPLKLRHISLEDRRSIVLHILGKSKLSNGKMSSSKLNDWLISRQRYWGTPIPIVYCTIHGAVPVPQKDLPVMLPPIERLDMKSSHASPLAACKAWVNTICPKCAMPAKRETDTMDTFVDSSWYFLRYLDPQNPRLPFARFRTNKILPVGLYIGGKEHAVLHLFYARFLSHFLADQKMVAHREPFKKLLAQGIIKGQTYQMENGKYVNPSEIDNAGDFPVIKETGEKVIASFQKMSKSKLNGVDPENFVNEWGISITRLFLLYAAAPFEDINWDVKTDVIPGVMRWQLKVWTCVSRLVDARNKVTKDEAKSKELSPELLQEIESICHIANKAIVDITNHFEKDCLVSAAITCLMTFAKRLSRISDEVVFYSPEFEEAVCRLIIMSAPMVPHFSSELWAGLRLMKYHLTEQGLERDVLDQSWPHPDFNTDFNLAEYKIKVDNRTCHVMRLPQDLDKNDETIRDTVLTERKVVSRLKGSEVEQFEIDTEENCITISAVK